MRYLILIILTLIIVLIQSNVFSQGTFETSIKDPIGDMCVTINTTKKPMTIYQIVTELRKQIGDVKKEKLLINRSAKDSTLEVSININDLKLSDALKQITEKYNNKHETNYRYLDDKELIIRIEGSRYILWY